MSLEHASEPLTVSVTVAARLLGVSRATAYQLAREGKLPVVRLRGRILVSRRGLSLLVDGESPARGPERLAP